MKSIKFSGSSLTLILSHICYCCVCAFVFSFLYVYTCICYYNKQQNDDVIGFDCIFGKIQISNGNVFNNALEQK